MNHDSVHTEETVFERKLGLVCSLGAGCRSISLRSAGTQGGDWRQLLPSGTVPTACGGASSLPRQRARKPCQPRPTSLTSGCNATHSPSFKNATPAFVVVQACCNISSKIFPPKHFSRPRIRTGCCHREREQQNKHSAYVRHGTPHPLAWLHTACSFVPTASRNEKQNTSTMLKPSYTTAFTNNTKRYKSRRGSF